MTAKQIDSLPISLDTALETLGMIQAHKDLDEFRKLEKEKQVLLGIADCSWEDRLAMFHKVHTVYCPMIRCGNY